MDKEQYYKDRLKELRDELALKSKALRNTQEELRQKNKEIRDFQTRVSFAFDYLRKKNETK